MKIHVVQDVLHHVKSLPVLPVAVQRLLSVADDLEVGVRALTTIIEKDQTLTARILRIANSCFYGLPRRVGTLSKAVVILGFQTVRNIALQIAVRELHRQANDMLQPHLEALWKHSLAVARVAQLLATRFRLPDSDIAFVAGLLHDLGKVVLMEILGERYTYLLEQTEQYAAPLHLREHEAFGIDHAAAGRALCEHWKIPPSLAGVVAAHHAPYGNNRAAFEEAPLTSTVRLANALAKIARIGGGGNPHVEVGAFHRIRTAAQRESLQQVLQALPSEIETLEAMFSDAGPRKAAVSERQVTRPISVGVCLKTSDVRDVVALALQEQGCAVVPIKETLPRDTALAGVIADDALPAALEERFSEQGLPLLSLALWPGGRASTPCTSVNIKHLHTWMSQELPKVQETP